MLEGVIIVSVNYDEKRPYIYGGVGIKYNYIRINFNEVDPEKDFRSAVEFAYKCYADDNVIGVVQEVMMSSSCDHFVMDCHGYKWVKDPLLGGLIVKE